MPWPVIQHSAAKKTDVPMHLHICLVDLPNKHVFYGGHTAVGNFDQDLGKALYLNSGCSR